MTPEQLAIAEQLVSIFMPYATGRRDEFIKRKGRFVHYTTAESGINIIRSRTIWMRNTNCMSDYREVAHGFDALFAFFSDQNKKRAFFDALDAAVPGAGPEAIKLYDAWLEDTRKFTYITSISEHDGAKEDQHGRLPDNHWTFPSLEQCSGDDNRVCKHVFFGKIHAGRAAGSRSSQESLFRQLAINKSELVAVSLELYGL